MKPFLFEDCPLNNDGTRQAVTRHGEPVRLLSDQGPEDAPIVGVYRDAIWRWQRSGALHGYPCGEKEDLFTPLTVRTIYFVRHAHGEAKWFETREEAEATLTSLGALDCRQSIFPVEVEE